jgi:hypothetical protein
MESPKDSTHWPAAAVACSVASMMRIVTVLALALSACAGQPPPKRLGPEPPRETNAALAGARCNDDGVCKCRAPGDDKEDPPPSEGTKRFEFRVGSGPGTVWVTINNSQRLYKAGEQVEECFYLDLAPGKHEVVLRGRSTVQGGGVGASLKVAEYAVGGENRYWWYDTLWFECGLPGPCEPDSLRAWKQEVDGYARSLRDPCGSTKLRGAEWETGTLPDGLHPDDLSVAVTLQVYPFAPKAGPGQCKHAGD